MKKELFQKFSEENPDLPFSLSYNWWNEVVKYNWDVAVVENQGEVKAVWPYSYRKKLGFIQLGSAEITPYTGPFIVYPEGQKTHRKYSFDKKIIDQLLLQLPKCHYFSQNCHLGYGNALPLHWKNFELNIRYTYVINDLSNLKEIYSQFSDSIRREVKKAEKEINVEESEDISTLIPLMESTFALQGMSVPLNKDTFYSFHEFIRKYSCGKIYLAKNFHQEVIAGIAIIWDHHSAYYLLGGAESEHRNSGAMSLLMWKAIQFSSTVVNKFNFEGSMNENIERFLRGFGGEQALFTHISHSNSLILKILKTIKK